MSRLDAREEPEGAAAWIRLSGELDISTVDELERRIAEAEGRDEVSSVVLDLRDLAFMDSTGLRLIVATDLRMREVGRSLQLVAGPEPVHRVFRLGLLEERLSFIEGAGRPGGGGSDGD